MIDQHLLRENRGRIGASRPPAADRNIEQDEKGMVINPLRSLGQVCRSSARIENMIHIEADLVWLPLNRVDVEVIGEFLSRRKSEGSANAVGAFISGPGNCAVNNPRLFADVLLDVDFATIGPVRFVDIAAKHPERWPDSLPAWDLDACLETSVGLREFE